jgi:hypothetical protein
MSVELVGLNEFAFDNYPLTNKHKFIRAISMSGTIDSVYAAMSSELHAFNDFYSDSFMHPKMTKVVFMTVISLRRIEYLVSELIRNQTSTIERLKIPHLFKHAIAIGKKYHDIKVPQILTRFLDRESVYYSFLLPNCDTRTLGKWRQHSNCIFTLQTNMKTFLKLLPDLERKYVVSIEGNEVILSIADGDLEILYQRHAKIMKNVIKREKEVNWGYFKARYIE